MVSILVVYSIEWRWCVLLPVRPLQCVQPAPSTPCVYYVSTAVVSHSVPCQVLWCGWCVSVCGVRVVGYPLSAPPSSWWWVGALRMVGWHGEVGWHGDGRAGAVMVALPSGVGVPRLVYSVAMLNGGSGVCVVPGSQVGFGILHCPASPCITLPALCCPAPLLSCVLPRVLRAGKCGGVCRCSFLPLPPSMCLLSQHCWFRVVSLWQGGVIVEWRW